MNFPNIQVLFDLIITLAETGLFFFLMTRQLEIKPSRILFVFLCLFEYFSVIILNYLVSSDSLRMCVTLLIQVSIACIISTSPASRKIFWGSIYMVIVVFADTVTFLLGALFTDYLMAERIFKYPVTYIMTLIYLFICCLCVFLLSRKRTEHMFFPWYLQICFFSVTMLGIVFTELLLSQLLLLNGITRLTEIALLSSITIFLLILFLTILLQYAVGTLYRKNLELVKENQRKQSEKQQFALMNQMNQALRTWRHDFHNHVSALQVMSRNGQWKELQLYLDKITEETMYKQTLIKTGNYMIDVILSSKLPSIHKFQISFDYHIFLPPILPLNDLELTTLLGNLFDNAIEACINQDASASRTISLEIKPYNQFLCLNMSNSCAGNYRFDSGGKLVSSKKEKGHGFGVKRIIELVEHAGGFLDLCPGKNSFQVKILIPLITPNSAPKGDPL